MKTIQATFTIDQLYGFSHKHESAQWPLGDSIAEAGWGNRVGVIGAHAIWARKVQDERDFRLRLEMKPGTCPILKSGNKRVSYLWKKGCGHWKIECHLEVWEIPRGD